ncbi:aminotransferase [Bisporella sp. PMI_857]|nr:aminotransferase [Bisporella sp. PMI_857]
MKAYRGYDGKLRLFRPDCNTRRMLISAKRIALPIFDPGDLEKLIFKLLEVGCPNFLPASDPGKFIYLRPTIIGTHCRLGVSVLKEAMLFILAAYMPELSEPQNGMRLFASKNDEVRAWPGGHGFAKVGANYGPTLPALEEAKTRGYDQILWLFGPEDRVTECGGSNFFIIWRSKEGVLKLQTAPLDDKLILDGVVRQSILELAKDRLCDHVDGTMAVVAEEQFTMAEVSKAMSEGRVVEAFTCGTAYFVCPISTISYEGKDFVTPMACGNSGRFTALFKEWLSDIFYGQVQHPWALPVDEK